MMVITNQENDQFSDELGRILLNDIPFKIVFSIILLQPPKSMAFEIFILILNIYALQTERHIINFYEKPRHDLNKKAGSYPQH